MHRVCADLAGCYEIPVWCSVRLGWFVALAGHVGRPSPMVTTGLCRIDLLERTIVDGARPDSRRMSTSLQNLSAEMTGSRHIHSTFHPASRCLVHLVCWQWTDHKFRVWPAVVSARRSRCGNATNAALSVSSTHSLNIPPGVALFGSSGLLAMD